MARVLGKKSSFDTTVNDKIKITCELDGKKGLLEIGSEYLAVAYGFCRKKAIRYHTRSLNPQNLKRPKQTVQTNRFVKKRSPIETFLRITYNLANQI